LYLSVSFFLDPLPSDPRSCSQKLQTRRILHDLFTIVHLMRPHPPPLRPCPQPPRSCKCTAEMSFLSTLSVYDSRDGVSEHTVPPSSSSSLTHVHRWIGSRNATRQTLPTSAKLTHLSMYDSRDGVSESLSMYDSRNGATQCM
jgi:hypothetical protein